MIIFIIVNYLQNYIKCLEEKERELDWIDFKTFREQIYKDFETEFKTLPPHKREDIVQAAFLVIYIQ